MTMTPFGSSDDRRYPAPDGGYPMGDKLNGGSMDFPTMVQYTTGPKTTRGNRLGRGSASTSMMEQYGYSAPGTNISLSNIGNPNVSVGNVSTNVGTSIGDYAPQNLQESGPGGIRTGLGGGQTGGGQTGGGQTGGGQTEGGQTGGGQTEGGRPGGGRPGGGRPGGGRPGGGRPGGGQDRQVNISRALNRAGSTGQDKNPRVTRGELGSILDRPNVGPIALRNQIRQGETAISRDATKFLNERLKAMGARPIETRTTSATAPNVQNTNQNRIQPFNSGSNPINPQQTMLAGVRTGQPPRGSGVQKARAVTNANKKK